MRALSAGGGWQAIFYVLRMAHRVGWLNLWRALNSKNACKTCALGMGGQKGGMTNERGHWPEVCKKSVQAMVSDMQGALQSEFFRKFSVRELQALSPRELEAAGRIHAPLYLAPGATHYRTLSWEDAFGKISDKLRTTAPDESFFYFSGRSSNEAGFLLQLLARVYGTNHVNNCSYYCHQASGVALQEVLGSGTATLGLEDLEKADCVFLIGANPASNHPRLMTTLKNLRARGGKVIVINPLREQGLVRFKVPSQPWSLIFGSTIASEYLQIKVGGDIALFHGLAKAVLEQNRADQTFISAATEGFSEWRENILALSWENLTTASGISRETIEHIAKIYGDSKNVVMSWCMGITHHVHGVANIQSICNLSLLRGMVGRPHAGLLPIRGHSNVQGMGSMAVTPNLKKNIFDKLQELGFKLPTQKGYDTMACMEAAHAGRMRFAWCLGGNLFGSNPDAAFARQAFSNIEMVVYLNTTLNTGHAHGFGKETLILPVLARDEEQQMTTQESMFNYVRLSEGGKPRLPNLKSEVEIIAAVGERLFPQHQLLRWEDLKRHAGIRGLIARIIPGYESIGTIDRDKHEFQIPGRVLHQARFPTASGRARFIFHPIPQHPSLENDQGFHLITLRSEGQFNTVVYEDYDLYRGQERRDVLLMNPHDMERLKLRKDDRITVRSQIGRMQNILVRPFDVTRGAAAMYYPEVNQIVERRLDPLSKTPSFKSTLVYVEKQESTH